MPRRAAARQVVAAYGQAACVAQTFAAGAGVHAQDNGRDRPVHCAGRAGRHAVAGRLVAMGVDVR